MLTKLGKLLGSQTSRQAAQAAIPGAAMNFAVGTLTGGPVAGAAYAAGDFLLNYPLVGLARKYFPGTPGGAAVITTKEGKTIKKDVPYTPSRVESGVNLVASLGSMPLVDYVTQGALIAQDQQIQPIDQSQTQQIYQQVRQREYINQLPVQALAPGTQFQAQGIEQTFHYPGVTLPPDVLQRMQNVG